MSKTLIDIKHHSGAVHVIMCDGLDPVAEIRIDGHVVYNDANLGKSLKDLGLHSDTLKSLWRNRIDTVRELVKRSEQDLLDLTGFGKVRLMDVKRHLEVLGLSLSATDYSGT